jgi:PAS domain S-box-containing protein
MPTPAAPLRRRGEPTIELPAALFRQLLDAAPDAMVIADAAGSIVLVNARVESLFGWPRGELIGQPVEVLIPERLQLAQMGTGLQRTGRRRDGGEFPVDVSLSPLEFKDHKLIIAAVRDVTDRRRGEEELREGQQRLSDAQEIAHFGSWEWNITQNSVRWSDELYRIYGLAPAQFPATYEGYMARIHPDDRVRVHEAIQRAYRLHAPFEFHERIVRPTGEIRWLQSYGRVTCDARGQPVRMTGTCQDVTDRKRAEQSFRELLEAAPDAMVMVDGDGRIVLVNSRTESLFRWNRSDLLGKPVEALIPQRFHQQHERHRAAYAAAPRVRSMGAALDLYGLRSDGSEFPIEVSLSPVTTETGVLSMAAIRDISDRKRADEVRKQSERELARRAEALARSNAELEQFAYVASHDLQEPLRTVASYTQLLGRRQNDDPRVAEYVDFITGGVRQMQVLIEDLLAYSRTTRIAAPPDAVDLNGVMKAVLGNLAGALAQSQGQVSCEPLPTVPGHASQLVQLLQNLIGNALKYRGTAPPEVRLGCRREAAGWQIWVSDNGIGIDAAHFEKIFVLFQRLHTRERYGGTGIGLALCRKIVTLHGGRIWVESAGAGKGSTFRFTLPERAPDS